MRSRITSLMVLCALIGGLCSPISSFAQEQTDLGFDPNRILDDDDIMNVDGMSYDRIVSFLRSKGTLADTKLADTDGIQKSVPDIIWRIARSYKINPKYLIALIQKEQSLVEDPNPSQEQFDWATGFAICDACSKNDPSVQEFKGFASQIEWAAKQHREKYLIQLLANGKTRAGKATGIPIKIDGSIVTPANQATVMLYSYTPHIHGNLNLWRIWRRWFSLAYPDGTIVRGSSSGQTYLIRFGKKRAFASKSVVHSLVDANKILTVSDTELSAYPDGDPIRFPKYALLRDAKQRIWLLTGTGKREIQGMKAFRKFGFNEDEVEDVDDADLAEYPVESAITLKTEFPQGVVLKDQTTKAYWYVENNTKQRIPDKIFLALYFEGRNIRTVKSTKLATYKTGDAYALHDGELVRKKTSSAVYVIENGKLRPIPSAAVFEAFGWKWKNVVTVPDAVLTPYTVADPMTQDSVSPPSLATL